MKDGAVMSLEEKLKNLPELPGVYLMKDGKNKIIYVGKAVNLKNRVRSYFSSQHINSPKTKVLVSNIRDLEYILTDSEVEALILESNMIKQFKPKYNVRLTDDKHYPYLRISLQDDYPRLEIVRSLKKDGARYFGPYTSSGAVYETLRLLKRLFPLRSCKKESFVRQERPCLNAHIKRCAAPCTGQISQEDYGKMIQEVVLFLEGKQEDLGKRLKERMENAAENLDFERAAEIRDQLLAVETVIAKQKIISDRFVDMDVINYARSKDDTCVQVFFVRRGKIVGRDHFFLDGSEGTEGKEILGAFLKQYYSQVEYIPVEVLLPESVDEGEVLATWLSARRGSRCYIRNPRQGKKLDLIKLVGKNALESLQQEAGTRINARERGEKALEEIARVLDLPQEPGRIECYDISHIQGAETVASMVVFTDGRKDTSQYRRFKIRDVVGPDDFASMAEVIMRRFQKAQLGDDKFTILPDLVIIDGGKGQLSAVRGVMGVLGCADITTIGLAKENEWIFVENSSEPIVLPRSSQGLQLLQRIRDEAHRFAITYHRLLRGKRNLTSALDEIPGIGPKRKEALLKHFGLSLKKISQASLEEISEVEGLSKQGAQQVWDYFHPS